MNSVRQRRLQRGWSQAELAERAGISRAAVSAIEVERLVPAVTAALSLARVFSCSVEELFDEQAVSRDAQTSWAFPPPTEPWRYWEAEVSGRRWRFPAERTGELNGFHDGVSSSPDVPSTLAQETLVVAGCDPAAGLLAQEYYRRTGWRMLILQRTSTQSLELLKQGLVHVAGLHFSNSEHASDNERTVREMLGTGYLLLRAAEWQEGIAAGRHVSAKTASGAVRAQLRWVGRAAGSAARRCQDELLSPKYRMRYVAPDHRSVAESIRAGWADAGVCVQLVCEEAGLQFFPVQQEAYDLCFTQKHEQDPRIRALIALIQAANYRSLLGDLPGYATERVGGLETVGSE